MDSLSKYYTIIFSGIGATIIGVFLTSFLSSSSTETNNITNSGNDSVLVVGNNNVIYKTLPEEVVVNLIERVNNKKIVYEFIEKLGSLGLNKIENHKIAVDWIDTYEEVSETINKYYSKSSEIQHLYDKGRFAEAVQKIESSNGEAYIKAELSKLDLDYENSDKYYKEAITYKLEYYGFPVSENLKNDHDKIEKSKVTNIGESSESTINHKGSKEVLSGNKSEYNSLRTIPNNSYAYNRIVSETDPKKITLRLADYLRDVRDYERPLLTQQDRIYYKSYFKGKYSESLTIIKKADYSHKIIELTKRQLEVYGGRDNRYYKAVNAVLKSIQSNT